MKSTGQVCGGTLSLFGQPLGKEGSRNILAAVLRCPGDIFVSRKDEESK